jgi:hypothetical protein
LRLPFAAKTPADSLGVRSIDPMIDYLPSMVESLRASILKLGLLSESDLTAAVNECRQHLAKPVEGPIALFAVAAAASTSCKLSGAATAIHARLAFVYRPARL